VMVAIDYLAESFAILNWFAEYLFFSTLVCVPIGNGIGDEGAKAVGDALKYSSMLTSLSLDFQRE
jgi:hypothetical protein